MHCGYCKEFSGTQSTLAKHFQKCAAALKEKVEKKGLAEEVAEKEAAKIATENALKQKKKKKEWQSSDQVKERRDLNRYIKEYREKNPFQFDPPDRIVEFPSEEDAARKSIWHVDLYNQLSTDCKLQVTGLFERGRNKIVEALHRSGGRKEMLKMHVVIHPDKVPSAISTESRNYIAEVQRELNNLMEGVTNETENYAMSNGENWPVRMIKQNSHRNFARAIASLPDIEALRTEAEREYEKTVRISAKARLDRAKAAKGIGEPVAKGETSPPKNLDPRKRVDVDLVDSDDDEEEKNEKHPTHDEQRERKRPRRAHKSGGGPGPRSAPYRHTTGRFPGGRRKPSAYGNRGRGGENDSDDGGGKPRAKKYPKDF